MEWTVIEALIVPELAGVLALCWVIGFISKRTPSVPDWLIIYIVTVVGVAITIALLGFSVDSIIQGVLAAAVAVYGNQLVRQTQKAVDNDVNS